MNEVKNQGFVVNKLTRIQGCYCVRSLHSCFKSLSRQFGRPMSPPSFHHLYRVRCRMLILIVHSFTFSSHPDVKEFPSELLYSLNRRMTLVLFTLEMKFYIYSASPQTVISCAIWACFQYEWCHYRSLPER